MYSNTNSFLRKLLTFVIVLSAISISAILVSNKDANAATGINQQINFQGRLLNAQGAVVPDGFYNVQFKIYQDGDGLSVGNTTGSPAGSLRWTESHLNQAGKGVQVKNGFMSVQLGSVTAFGSSVDWNQDTLWISMNVGNTNGTCTPFTSCGGDGEMIPMKRLSSTPYAMNAGQLGGKTSAQFLQLAQGVQTDASTNTTSVFINKTSTGNFMQLQASGTDVFTVSNSGDITLGNNANHSIAIAASAPSTAGRVLTISGGTGGSGTGTLGGNLVLQGGAAGGTNANGGDLVLNAGAKTGTGIDGVIALGTTNTSAINLNQNTAVLASSLTVGTAAVAGNVVISDGSSNTATITVGNLTGNFTYSLPVTTANDTICLQTFANCTSTGVTTVGTYNPAGTNVNGASISGNSIIFQDASTTAPGMVGTGSQSFAGDKTFTGNINTSSQYQIGGSNLLSGSALTFTAASGNSIQASNNQSLSVQGGVSTTLNANGGGVAIAGGAGNGTGAKGLVNIGPTSYAAVTNSACAVDCTISQANVDGFGTIIISASTSDIIITLPAPTITTMGRTVFVTTASGSQDFTLRTNTGLNIIDVAMRQNTTSTMIWNGTAWTPGGASNATTLQATYNNGSNPSTTPEIKLDSIRGTIDIQDADTTIGTDILNIRGSNASALGTVLFGVSNTGRVTIQGTTDQSSAFRVLGSNGDYLFNINSANSYVISNATRSPGNEISNPGLETGGEITSGEEGWFGPANVSIENDTANAKAGNHLLQIGANSTNTDAYAGKFYEVLEGEMLYFEGWVKNSAGANGNAGIQITWYNKDKGILSNSTAYPNTPGTTYVQRTVSGLAPAGAHYARVSATIRSNATVGTFYFDNFYMKRNIENADMLYRNSTDSSTAFRIQSAGAAQTIFTANTANNTVKIGDNTGTGANTTLLVLDSTTSDPSTLTGLNGGIFYRSDNNSLKAVVGGAVVDICTTAVTCSGYSASAGSAIALQGSTPGTQQVGNFNISGTGILTAIKTMDNATGSTQALSIRSGNATGGNSGSITIDVGTASGGSKGTITIGSTGVATTMPGTLAIQGSNSLVLGSSSSASGSILFRTSAGANTVTLSAPAANPTASYNLVLPTALGGAGECLKTDAGGNTYFQGCGVGVNFNLQDAYNNSGTPADITLADGKDLTFTAQDTAGIEPSVLINLACTVGCAGTDGRFSVQNNGVDVFTVSPNGAGITLSRETQIGSSITDATETLFQLDSYNQPTDDPAQGCSTTVNQGAMYYNTSMGSIRSCINGAWSDVSNPDTLGLLTFGIVPSSGGQPYDLPSLINNGSSGPCKVSWASTTSVSIQACTAYSNGRRLAVPARTLTTNSASTNNISLTTGARWGHICISPTSGEPAFTSTTGTSTPTANMPAFDAETPILCLADVVSSTSSNGVIDDIYDTRTFTSAMKEAINLSTPTELGMTVDAGTGGAMVPAGSGSAKLYGTVVATDGATSAGAPNAIVTTVGPAWVKATAGTAGQFVKTNTPSGYSNTTASIPNNSFYYSVGNTRTSWSSTCSSPTNCAGSLYVNFIVR